MANFKDELINNLSDNIAKLTELYQLAKENNKMLKIENSDLQKLIINKGREYNELDSRFNTLKLTKALIHHEGDSDQVKYKVNNLVREIDKCIALLNR